MKRTVISCLLAIAAVLALPGLARASLPAGSEDDLARAYYVLLEKNTPFQESTWNAQTGAYPDQDFYFAGTLGNAVLLKLGSYDPSVAGVPREQLLDHTVRSIAYAAAHDRYVDPNGDWGITTYWDNTFEAYLAAAAHLMWDDLDAQTRANIDTIVRDAANRMVSTGATDPSTNGLQGGWVDNTRQEEMGARTMTLAAALAYLPDDPNAPQWREWLDTWLINMNGLPVADQANSTPIDGRPISAWNTAHNIFDTFIVENHGSWNPIYQQSAGAYPGRDSAQFEIAGRSVPDLMRLVPNTAPLWDTMGQLGTDAGVPEDYMVADRHHLYGRNLLPIVDQSMVNGDRYAARAERMLAAHLGPYVDYPPAGRLTKFSGEPKYEPEARAELGMAYLLHYWRADLAGDVQPVSEADYFRHFSWARDYGSIPSLTAQQTPRALSAAVTKPAYVKFAFLPQHDDWLFDVAGGSPSLLPSTAAVDQRSVHVYRRARDGYEATATTVRRGGAYAGFTTLPNGEVVYATTGTAADEGVLHLYNLDMPGVPGLDGDRTFTAQDGSVTLSAGDTTTRTFHGPWLNVDGRAGFAIGHSDNPISVSATSATLSSGPAAGAAGMVVRGYPAQSADETARKASEPQPAGGPAALRAALSDSYLSLFNLGADPIRAADLTVPQSGPVTLYEGEQRTASNATRYVVTLDGGTAAVQAPRFALQSRDGGAVPADLDVNVVDSRHVLITNDGDAGVARLRLVSSATGEAADVTVPPGRTAEATFQQGGLTPVANLARAQITYPVAPLPAGMSDPAGAVDGDPATAWTPGAPGRRMVVNLGGRHQLSGVTLDWAPGHVPASSVEVSDDGVTWTQAASGAAGGAPEQRMALDAAAQYVSVRLPAWAPGDAGLAELAVDGSQETLQSNGDGGVDEVRFAPTQARYVRMLGVKPATQYGYSIFTLAVHGPDSAADLALNGATTASSYDADSLTLGGPFPPSLATDGDDTTRWAVAKTERSRTDSWLAVDLGAEHAIDDVRILWESAYGAAYEIQVSDDGSTWRDVAAVP